MIVQGWVASLLHFFDTITLAPWGESVSSGQQTLKIVDGHNYEHSPIFEPPSSSPDFLFKCNYTTMGPGWVDCSDPKDRSCWLKGPVGGKYDINTNYEKDYPIGVLRQYHLNLTETELAPDGVVNNGSKVFNGQYPGPWIQACWGDEIEIVVTNNLKHNGTTIHWHGIRQHGSVEMDGVNGVTQCPMAPGRTGTYRFRATQYGSSWYHSHYSLQYGDGLLGPMTIYGPSSANYDEAVRPTLMTDWNHRSAFEDFYVELTKGPPNMPSILLNGTGQYKCTPDDKAKGKVCGEPPSKYTIFFKKGTKYLLRLINTSVDTTFKFAIDNHDLTVISSDFVPIVPYKTDSVLVGIGQRYHVVVEAKPVNISFGDPPENYWIRTIPATGCNTFLPNNMPANTTGILRYNANDTAMPTTVNGSYSLKCSDEPYENLKPILPWTVGKPSNEQQMSTFQAGLTQYESDNNWTLPHGNFSRWDLGSSPLWLDFSNPTIKNVQPKHPDGFTWNPEWVVVPQNYKEDDWVYLVVTATGFPWGKPKRKFVPAAHPIHLHGHDFAILAQSNQPYWDPLVKLNLNNPPRRDVALLPANGYLVLAFKSDNPGSWLLHCHIAWHASSGLALQILEREPDIKISDTSKKAIDETCERWKEWHGNRSNWYNSSQEFQDDSGI